jgi:CDP-6-deoxy-D-xylo-4-hexulose-3-dehydrase
MSKIKLVSDTISKKNIQELNEWLSSEITPQLTKGPLTIDFQNKWSDFFGDNIKSCFVNSGSSAILLSLLALKIKNQVKKVVVPSVSWATDLSSPMILGLDVVLCDCNMEDLSMDLDQLEEIFKNESPDACILVSVLGLVPDMKRVTDLCEKYNVILLEDVCESLGSKHQGKLLGTFGNASFFSLYYGHHLSTIEGGMISTTDPELWDLLVSIRNHGWDRDWIEDKRREFSEKYGNDSFTSMYTFYYPGLNVRSTDLQAFVGMHQLENANSFFERRNENFLHYTDLIKETSLKVRQREGDFVSNFSFPVLHSKRKEIVDKLIADDIEVRPLIAGSMGKQPFASVIDQKYELKNSEIIHNYGFYLPNHQDLSKEDIERISKIVNSEKNEL